VQGSVLGKKVAHYLRDALLTLDIAQNVWMQAAGASGGVRELPLGWGAAEVDSTASNIASKIAGFS